MSKSKSKQSAEQQQAEKKEFRFAPRKSFGFRFIDAEQEIARQQEAN